MLKKVDLRTDRSVSRAVIFFFFTPSPPSTTTSYCPNVLSPLPFSWRARFSVGRTWWPPPPEPKEKLVSTGWLSISGDGLYFYIHTYYICVGTTQYIVSFFPSYGFLFIFFLSARRLKNRRERPPLQDKLIIRLTFFPCFVKRFLIEMA